MNEELPPTNPQTSPFVPPPGDGVAPSGRLPGPHAHIQLTEVLDNDHREPRVYRATSSDKPQQNLIVEFLPVAPANLPNQDPSRPRHALDLRLWREQGWPPVAIVTCLPIDLPEPYSRIQLQDFIGRGGMGQVWLAVSLDHPGQLLAVKFMTLPLDPSYKAQFIAEVKAGLEIGHQCIVRTFQLLDFDPDGADGWPPFGLVMQRQEISLGTVLRDLTRSRKRLPQVLAIEWSRNLLDALIAVHRNGRVHRDLKPDNVLLQLAKGKDYTDAESIPDALHDSHALLSDLGTVAEQNKPPLFTLFQDGYKAPELFDALGNPRLIPADPAEDLFAFGLVLQVLAKVVDGSPQWLHDVARALTQTDPNERPAATPLLRYRLSPDWRLQEYMIGGGWNPDAHKHFTGRDFVFKAFDKFCKECGQQNRGGIFLIEGQAGIGKTALVTEWAGRGDPHPAFFFRKQEGRTVPTAMPETLFQALCQRYEVKERALPERKEQYAAELAALLKHIAGEKLGANERLLLFVDGVDEADDPEEVVQYLPKSALLANVFLIVASRPRIGEQDHLASLRSVGAGGLELAGEDEHNLGDLQTYLQKRLPGQLADEQAQNLATALGGIFQLAVYFIEEIDRKKMTVSDALQAAAGLASLPVAEKVFAWYRKTWERIQAHVPGREDQKALTDFIRLVAAAIVPIGERQIQAILQWDIERLDWAWRLLEWLVASRTEGANGYEETYLRLRHQSVLDYLLSKKYRGPARDGLDNMHARIGRHYLEQAKGGWPNVEPYGLAFLVRHLVAANQPELLKAAAGCLTNLEYLEATLSGASTDG